MAEQHRVARVQDHEVGACAGLEPAHGLSERGRGCAEREVVEPPPRVHRRLRTDGVRRAAPAMGKSLAELEDAQLLGDAGGVMGIAGSRSRAPAAMTASSAGATARRLCSAIPTRSAGCSAALALRLATRARNRSGSA